MVDIWYMNIEGIDARLYKCLLESLPQKEQESILRYRFQEDRTRKLLGRMVIRLYHEHFMNDFDWSSWAESETRKPYLKNGKEFNISHSGNYVGVAFSSTPVGFDIEKIDDKDVRNLESYLHPKEQKALEKSRDRTDLFFQIWTRKEALLKAKGEGFKNGLAQQSVLQSSINNEWYIQPVEIANDYKSAVCTTIENSVINQREITQEELLELRVEL